MTPLYLFSDPPAWWKHLERLDEALQRGDAAASRRAHAATLNALAGAGYVDLAAAAADLLLYTSTPFSRAAMMGSVPAGLDRAMTADLSALVDAVRRGWTREVSDMTGVRVPELAGLGPQPERADRGLADALAQEDVASIRPRIVRHYECHGDGHLAKFLAFRWTRGDLEGISSPSLPRLERLVGLDRQLGRLVQNTDAFLDGHPAHHTLLYGPRGSGKSTAVRGLLQKDHARGLRLVEIAVQDLERLPRILETLRGRPHRYVLFVDDLSFEQGDTTYHPLKTLLEGSLTEPPGNTLLYATSNRRHLVREAFGDRPDPLDDDVHAWDTQHERLALSDRFGLAITFPDASQRRYLEIVRGLIEELGAEASDGVSAATDLEERAIRFAEWGNGYSGRTAEQFVRSLRSTMLY